MTIYAYTEDECQAAEEMERDEAMAREFEPTIPPRGILIGIMLATCFWAVVILLYLMLR